jgi:hypothetical protein
MPPVLPSRLVQPPQVLPRRGSAGGEGLLTHLKRRRRRRVVRKARRSSPPKNLAAHQGKQPGAGVEDRDRVGPKVVVGKAEEPSGVWQMTWMNLSNWLHA